MEYHISLRMYNKNVSRKKNNNYEYCCTETANETVLTDDQLSTNSNYSVKWTDN